MNWSDEVIAAFKTRKSFSAATWMMWSVVCYCVGILVGYHIPR